MNLEQAGKNAIVTGASRGIGKSIALKLAEAGVNVAICARGEAALRAAEEEMAEKGVRVYAQPCDVGDPEQLESFI